MELPVELDDVAVAAGDFEDVVGRVELALARGLRLLGQLVHDAEEGLVARAVEGRGHPLLARQVHLDQDVGREVGRDRRYRQLRLRRALPVPVGRR